MLMQRRVQEGKTHVWQGVAIVEEWEYQHQGTLEKAVKWNPLTQRRWSSESFFSGG